MGFNLKGYNLVSERVLAATPEYRGYIESVVADPPTMLTDVYGYVSVTVVVRAIDTDGDIIKRDATGIAHFDLSLSGRSAQATAPLEDAETSAVGRALAFLGYATTGSLASQDEINRPRQSGAERNGAPRDGTSGGDQATEKQINFAKKLAKSSALTDEEREKALAVIEEGKKSRVSGIIDRMSALIDERK